MHCIAHRSYGVCTVLTTGALGYALHCPQELWAMHCIAQLGLWGMHCIALLGLWGMHCIAHRIYGVCTALPIEAMGYALHYPWELWGKHCIAHRSYRVCTALPIGAMGFALHCP